MARAPTSGTRHGNGAGWGGPAKGASTARKPMPMPGPGAAHMDIPHRLDVAERRAEYGRIYDEALARTIEKAQHVHQRVLAASGDGPLAQLASASVRLDAEVMDRTGGKPVPADDASLHSEVEDRGYIDAPPKAKSMEEWTARMATAPHASAGT